MCLCVQQSARHDGALETVKSDSGCLAAAWAAGPPWGCCAAVGPGAVSWTSPPEPLQELASVTLPSLGQTGGGPGIRVAAHSPQTARAPRVTSEQGPLRSGC